MEEDLPYQVEYAKSGRASCKICKIPISQGSLRIARMIQSPHFDGKIPNWHHQACFFKKYMPKSCAEIGKFDAVRWDDQEKIREIIGEDAVDGGSKENQYMPNTDFLIEYSKSGRAKCRSCEEKIEKDVVRVAKMEMPDEPKKGVGLVPRWRHLDCFIAARDELGAEDLLPQQIPGFNELKKDDRDDITRKFGVPEKKSIKKEETDVPDQKPDMEKLKEKEVLRKQSKRFWQVRDQLQTQFELKAVRNLLEMNGHDSTGGEAQILDRCADGILFGNLDACPECKQKRIRYSAEKGYVCHGDLTEWTNCTYRTFTPKRTVWKITKEYREGTFLEKVKLKVVERKFPSDVVAKANADSAFGSQGSLASEVPGKPLNDKKVVLIGKLKESRTSITAKVEGLGGMITDTVNCQCFCCISSPGEVLKMTSKMTKAESCNIPVVAEEYLDAITKGGAETMLSQFAIAPWGARGGESSTETTRSGGVKRKKEAGEIEGSSSSKKAKVTLKGGAEVDPAFEKADCCHLLNINGEIYTAVLGLVNLVRGSNSYYKLQLLQHDTKKSRYYVFRSWGRVGTTIGSSKTEQFECREDAVENFLDLYYEKTGNLWSNRKNFVKKPNQFYPLDIDYGQDDEVVKSAIEPGSRSKLAEPIKELIKFIFDIEAMKDALVEFEIDLKKMPLGKLSRKQIETAYSCLTESLKYVQDGVTGGKVLDVSNRFYTLIPHDFGLDTPPLLNRKELIDVKIKMLDSLLEIEVAYNICKKAKEDEDPVDVHYESLNTALNVVDKNSEEFQMICTYVANTHAKTHSTYSLEVEEVFDVSRKGEKQKYRPFKDLHNRKLLWHGSRSTNYVGILSQGLRIAPPEAPVTGYMFGKGVYFADMASKSANYCNTNRSNNTGLMLLCEVALGNEYQLTASEHIVKLPPGKHSCKGLGKTGPDPNLQKTLPDGVVVPLGTGVEDSKLKSTLLYNEYIIYDTAQCNMKYLVKLKFNYKY